MTAPSSRYAHHLALGLSAYAETAGRTPTADQLDVTVPEVRARYDRFRSRPYPTRLGATEGEWAALRLGLKRVLRERLDRERLEELQTRCAREGLLVRAEQIPAPLTHKLDGTATAPLRDLHVYVGRTQDDIDEAASLDGIMVPFQSADPDGEYDVTREHNQRLGELLGYPACCVASFGRWHRRSVSNWDPISVAAAASQRFDPLLNNIALGGFHFIGWFPCRYDCPASIGIAEQVEVVLRRTRADAIGAAFHALATPRVYLDERRQLLLDGHVDSGRVRYRRVFTPYAVDRRASTAAYEWVFYADMMTALSQGDTLSLDEEGLVVGQGTNVVARVAAPSAIWLPFGS